MNGLGERAGNAPITSVTALIHDQLKRNITHDFFDLQTKLAGEILQKFSNYRIRLVIVGDWSKYTSRSLEAFIYESNRGKTVNFSSSPTEAVKLLSRIN